MSIKKVTALVLCVVILLGTAACGEKTNSKFFKKTAEYEIGSYKIALPSNYALQDLKEVKAKDNCIAMLKDASGKLPDLWICEDEMIGQNLEDHIKNQSVSWFYDMRNFYTVTDKDGNTNSVACTGYQENRNGQYFYNEHYYSITDKGTVLSFDFAYDMDAADKDNLKAAIQDVAKFLGF